MPVQRETTCATWLAVTASSINSPALSDPDLINRLSARFGAQCVVVGIDSQTIDGDFRVYQFTGDPTRTRDSARSTLDWVKEVQIRGAGEIVLDLTGLSFIDSRGLMAILLSKKRCESRV